MKYNYDTIIIGGGITGACVVWDATLRGAKCLLVEKNDFSSGTSQATSKLIHGGLRYLKNMEVGLVRESLRERRTLAKISPHAVETLGFAIPNYSKMESLVLRAGMEMYDRLSWDRNDDISLDKLIPRYSHWSRKRAIHEMPRVPRKNLNGAFLYYDYANTNPERHTTEFIFSAKKLGAKVCNYTEVTGIESLPSSQGYKVRLLDKITGKTEEIFVRSVVNAGGPWADLIESQVGIRSEKHIVRSKGIHIVTRKIAADHCIVLKKRDGSHLFIIPWRGKTIIGTTDSVYEGHPDDFKVTREDILDLLDEINNTYGYTNLTEQDVDFYYGGMRPLVEDPGEESSSYNASRKSEVMDHGEDGYPGFFSAMGGKYTTSRAVAENLTDKLVAYLPGKFAPCTTETTPLLSGEYSDLHSVCQMLSKKFPNIRGEKLEILASRYGSLTESVLKTGNLSTAKKGKKTDLLKTQEIYFELSGGERIYEEEIRYISREESIVYATDFFFRRSGAGTTGCPPIHSLDGILKIIGDELKWPPSRVKKERELVLSRYTF